MALICALIVLIVKLLYLNNRIFGVCIHNLILFIDICGQTVISLRCNRCTIRNIINSFVRERFTFHVPLRSPFLCHCKRFKHRHPENNTGPAVISVRFYGFTALCCNRELGSVHFDTIHVHLEYCNACLQYQTVCVQRNTRILSKVKRNQMILSVSHIRCLCKWIF